MARGSLRRALEGKERIAHYIQSYQSHCPLPLPLEDLTKALHQTKTRYFETLVKGGSILLRPGVKRLLQEARDQQVRLAIATTSARDNVIPLLQQLLGPESPGWFEVIATGDSVTAKKPDPEVYHRELDKLGLEETALELLKPPKPPQAAVLRHRNWKQALLPRLAAGNSSASRAAGRKTEVSMSSGIKC